MILLKLNLLFTKITELIEEKAQPQLYHHGHSPYNIFNMVLDKLERLTISWISNEDEVALIAYKGKGCGKCNYRPNCNYNGGYPPQGFYPHQQHQTIPQW